jgi:magnesium transporter
LEKVLVLASFIPIIAGMGGNIATQSSTIVVRSLATGRINMENLFSIVGKEFLVGVVMGSCFGVLLGFLAHFEYASPGYLGLVVGLSIFFVMTMAATVGTLVPLVLKRLNIDAAIATGPFITTTTDILGVFLFLSVARILLDL